MYIIESYHDYNVWKASVIENYSYTKKWHTYDLFFHIFMASLISYLVEGISYEALWLLFNIGMLRFVIFNISLNILRKKKWYYLSKDSNFIDKFLKNNEKIVFISSIIVVILTWIYYFLQ